MALEVKVVKKDNGSAIVHVNGRLDSETTKSFEAQLKPALVPGAAFLIFDFKKLEYISSAGLRAVLAAHKFMNSQKGRCAIRNMQPPIQKVFEIAGMIPNDIAATEKSEDIFLDATQRSEAIKYDDVSL